MAMHMQPELISFTLCPYVQRAIIVMAEKGIAHKRTYIDLAKKPEWFLAISPTGKVPVLRMGDDVLFESNVITEYLDEVSPGSLHPADPLQKAQHRAWIEFGSTILGDIAGFYSARTGDAFDQARTQLTARFKTLDDVLGDGPFFAGEQFHLVDAVYGTISRYLDAFDAIRDFGLLAEAPKVRAYFSNLKQRPSIRDAVRPEYPDLLQGFLRRRDSALSHMMN